MKNLLIVANWKSNITKNEARIWLDEFSVNEIPGHLKIILMPSFTLLDNIYGYIRINDLSLKLGAQNVSSYDPGAFTGEINASQIKEFVEYVLIGHSERRSNLGETEDEINKKIEKAIKEGIKPIVCVSNLDQVKSLMDGEFVIAYEPIESIGTGNAENPSTVSSIVKDIKKIKNLKVIYGGSVSAENLKDYIELPEIDGVLVGGKSLNADSFLSIIKNAI